MKMLLWLNEMGLLLLLGSFAVIGLAVSQDEAPAADQELSQLQATVTRLMGKVEHLEKKLQSFESDPLAVYFESKSHIKKRDYTHSYNSYHGNGTFVFCRDNLFTRSVQKRSDYSHSYNDYDGNGTFVFCGGGSVDKSAGGVSYIVWGKQYCPNGQTLYSGVIGGNAVAHSAGGSNQLCLPDTPKYASQYTSSAQQRGLIFPGKYDTSSFTQLSRVHGKLARCAACYNSGSSTSIMIPARISCPRGWNQEYYGYLMAQPDVRGYYRQEFICVHKDMDARNPLPGKSSSAYLLSPVETVKNGAFNSLYDSAKELSCTVCSK